MPATKPVAKVTNKTKADGKAAGGAGGLTTTSINVSALTVLRTDMDEQVQ